MGGTSCLQYLFGFSKIINVQNFFFLCGTHSWGAKQLSTLQGIVYIVLPNQEDGHKMTLPCEKGEAT